MRISLTSLILFLWLSSCGWVPDAKAADDQRSRLGGRIESALAPVRPLSKAPDRSPIPARTSARGAEITNGAETALSGGEPKPGVAPTRTASTDRPRPTRPVEPAKTSRASSASTGIFRLASMRSQPRPDRKTAPNDHLEWVDIEESSNDPEPSPQRDGAMVAEPLLPSEARASNGAPNATVMDKRLNLLRKPIEQLVVSSYLSDQPTPKDRAASLWDAEEQRMIFAEGPGPVISSRYPFTMCHQPLYFEQRNLERCGNTLGYFQNTVSAGCFFIQTATLPYQICRQRNRRCVQAGPDCRTCEQLEDCPCITLRPLDAPALSTEAAALVGFSFLLL